MASKINICNIALQKVGANRITSLDDGTAEANFCSTVYDQIVEEVISEGAWSAAIRRASLAQTTNTPAFEYTYEYQLPVDPRCISVVEINACLASEVPYVIEGDKLLCNETSAQIKYTVFLTSSSSYGVFLTSAIVARLAWELSYNFTGNASLVADYEQRYMLQLQKSLASDALQGTADSLNTDGYLLNR